MSRYSSVPGAWKITPSLKAVMVASGKVEEIMPSATTPSKGPVVRWKSHGSGVVYEPAKPMSRRKYHTLQLERVARELRQGAQGESVLLRSPWNR